MEKTITATDLFGISVEDVAKFVEHTTFAVALMLYGTKPELVREALITDSLTPEQNVYLGYAFKTNLTVNRLEILLLASALQTKFGKEWNAKENWDKAKEYIKNGFANAADCEAEEDEHIQALGLPPLN